jgi:L-2-hydroxyglutarate oxidase
VTLDDLQPYPAGVRAQAVKPDGTTLDDFLFIESKHALIVGNAPSPAATSAMPIARYICEKVKKRVTT